MVGIGGNIKEQNFRESVEPT